MQINRAIVDTSSLLWGSIMFGKDKEHGKTVTSEAGKEVHVNSAIWGYENVIKYLTEALEKLKIAPRDAIFVIEGKNSKSLRQAMFSEYKAGRDKVPEQYEVFNEVKAQLMTTFANLGSIFVWQDGLEADDVIAYLAQNLEGDRYIISNDKDLAQLVGPGPRDQAIGDGWSGQIHHLRQSEMDRNPFGPFSHQFIPVSIALVGDTSDGIKGAKGFGAKAFEDLLVVFGGDDGLEQMEHLIKRRELHRLAEDVAECKALQKVIDDAEGVYLSYALGRLYPEKVNTMKRPLKYRVGMVKPRDLIEDMALRKFGGSIRLVHADNYEAALQFYMAQALMSREVGLDLETWAGEESETWLAQRTKKGGGVDVMGSLITGVTLVFGNNGQYQFYLALDHKETGEISNLTKDQVGAFLKATPQKALTLAHNAAGFELPVLFNHFGAEWKDNGWRGFFPNMVDTRIAATYWDEDRFTYGLKDLSKDLLDYTQETYEEVTSVHIRKDTWDGQGKVLSEYIEKVPSGEFHEAYVYDHTGEAMADENGVFLKQKGAEVMVDGPEMLVVQFRMNEITAERVLSYGVDDGVTAHALWNFFRLVMELEGTLGAFFRLEQKPVYLSAMSYVEGVPVSIEHVMDLKRADDIKFDEHSKVLDAFLIEKGWEGTVCPVYSDIDAAAVKESFLIITGTDFPNPRLRTVSKMAKLIEEDHPILAKTYDQGDVALLNQMVAAKFDGKPQFDVASPKQVAHLLYTVMGLPIRLRNAPTDVMRAKGIEEGTVRTDDDAIKMAQKLGDVEPLSTEHKVLSALIEMKSINTKRGLYYEPYPNAVHWKTKRIHPELVQSGTNTRRWSARNPNIQQLDSEYGGIRAAILPHHRDAVVVSLDESAQEVRQAADYSQDSALLTCYLGDKSQLRDVHSIVGARIAGCYYEEFVARRKNSDKAVADVADKIRGRAKVTLFATLYGAGAAKIGEGLGITKDEAQGYIDAIYAQFPGLKKWKTDTESTVEKLGRVPVHGGTIRHLATQLQSLNGYISSKALRQASNARIQSAGANQMKTIMSDIWDSNIIEEFDYRWYFPVHDETVHSIGRGDAAACMGELHKIMTKQFLSTVPSASSIGFGRSFGTLTEVGEVWDADLIEKTLNDIFNESERKAA